MSELIAQATNINVCCVGPYCSAVLAHSFMRIDNGQSTIKS